MLGEISSAGGAALDNIRLDGMTDPLILEQVFAEHLRRTPSTAESAAVFDAYVSNLAGELVAGEYRVLPGVNAMLDAFAARDITLGLQTGNLRAGAQAKLSHGQLWDRFVLGGFGSDARVREDLVAHAIALGEKKLGAKLARHEVLVIGDTPRDIEAGRASGATTIGVATGSFSVAALAAAGADRVLPDLTHY